MDDIDSQIIDILAKNSRVSFRRISKETGLSTDTVMRRYQRLEKEGQIQPVITVDYAKLGYESMAFFFIRVTAQSSLSTTAEEVAKIPDVIAIITATGLYDLMVIALVRGIKHSFKIGNEIEKISNIRKVTIDLFQLPPEGDATFPPPGWHNLQKQGYRNFFK